MSNKKQLSIIVPCYNEVKNLPLLCKSFAPVAKNGEVELILVDNGSADGSNQVIKKLLTQYKFARMVSVGVNQGYGYGILSGLKQAKGQYIGWIHADLQTDPKSVSTALQLILSHNGETKLFIKGLRRKRSLTDLIFTTFMGWFELVILHKKMVDINAQPTIFSRSLYDNWGSAPHDFSLDLFAYYTALKSNYRVIRYPVVFKKRIHGKSTWNNSFGARWKLIKRVLMFSFKLRKDMRSENYRPQN